MFLPYYDSIVVTYINIYLQGQPKKNYDISWPIIVAKSLLLWPTVGFLIQKKTTIGKTSLIVGCLCQKKTTIISWLPPIHNNH